MLNSAARPASTEENGLIGLEEAAAYLGISLATARRWCESGRLPARKEGRNWTIKRADLVGFLPPAPRP